MRFFVRLVAGGLLLAFLASPASAREIWERQPPHGRELMSRTERKIFWREFLALETDAERSAYWLAHIEAMDRRALEWGVSLEPARMDFSDSEANLGFWRPPYFSDIMTDDELAHYRSDLDAIPDREDRRRYVREHIVRMQLRAAKRGVSIPSALDFDDVFDDLSADEAGAAAILNALGYDPTARFIGDADPPAGDSESLGDAGSESLSEADSDSLSEGDADSLDAGENTDDDAGEGEATGDGVAEGDEFDS